MKADIVVLWLVPAFWPASSGRAGPGRRPYLFDESRPAVYAKTVCEGRI